MRTHLLLHHRLLSRRVLHGNKPDDFCRADARPVTFTGGQETLLSVTTWTVGFIGQAPLEFTDRQTVADFFRQEELLLCLFHRTLLIAAK